MLRKPAQREPVQQKNIDVLRFRSGLRLVAQNKTTWSKEEIFWRPNKNLAHTNH